MAVLYIERQKTDTWKGANIAIAVNEIAVLYISGQSLYVHLNNSDNSQLLGNINNIQVSIITENNKQKIPVERLIVHFAEYIAGYKPEPPKGMLDDYFAKLPLDRGNG